MPKIDFERHVRHSPDDMLELIADVQSYPEFVPNCTAMQTAPLQDEPDGCLARMHIKFGPVSQSYESRVVTDRQARTVTATATESGLFKHLDTRWSFVPEGEGTRIRFDIDFSIANRLIAAIAEPAFAAKQEEVVDAFLAEADRRYGTK